MKKMIYLLILSSIVFTGCSVVEEKDYLGNYDKAEVVPYMRNDNILRILMIDLIRDNKGFATFVEIPLCNDSKLSLGNEENINLNLMVLPLYSMTGLGQKEYFVIKNEGVHMARVEGNMLILYLMYKVKPVLEEDYVFFEKELFLEYDSELNSFTLIKAE